MALGCFQFLLERLGGGFWEILRDGLRSMFQHIVNIECTQIGPDLRDDFLDPIIVWAGIVQRERVPRIFEAISWFGGNFFTNFLSLWKREGVEGLGDGFRFSVSALPTAHFAIPFAQEAIAGRATGFIFI